MYIFFHVERFFSIVLSLAVFQFQSPSICEGDVVDIVFNGSTQWHMDLSQATAEDIHPLLE